MPVPASVTPCSVEHLDHQVGHEGLEADVGLPDHEAGEQPRDPADVGEREGQRHAVGVVQVEALAIPLATAWIVWSVCWAPLGSAVVPDV